MKVLLTSLHANGVSFTYKKKLTQTNENRLTQSSLPRPSERVTLHRFVMPVFLHCFYAKQLVLALNSS